MRAAVQQKFDNYSESALQKVIDTCPGKPIKGEYGALIGTIISGKRVDNTNVIEFKTEMEVI